MRGAVAHGRRGAEDGFALLATMWLVVAISALVLGMSLAARDRRLAVANRLEAQELDAAARGGLAIARERLSVLLADTTLQRDDPWRDPQRWVSETLMVGRARVSVTARSLNALVPLHATEGEGIEGFLEGVGADGDVADRLGEVAADWQDGDTQVRGRGAEEGSYRRSGAVIRPRNGYFAAPQEFCELDRMPTELCAEALPFLTTLGTGRVDLNSAPVEVLRSLPGVSAPVAELIVARRGRGEEWRAVEDVLRFLPPTLQGEVTRNLPELTRRVGYRTLELHLIVTATLDGSPVEGRVEAVLTRAGDAAFQTWYRTS